MMEDLKVVRVVDEFAKHGHSEKTNKDWSMSRVELSNGESAFIFNPIAAGDVVEAKQNGDYTNYVKKKVDPARDAMLAILTRIEAKVDKLLGEAPKPAQTAPKSLTEAYREQRAAKAEVVDDNVDENTEIDLSQIPF